MVRDKIARTIRRLNLHGVIMKLPIFGQAIYDGLSLEFERVDDFRNLVKNSVVPNKNMDISTLDDYEKKYNVRVDPLLSDDERIDKIIERAGLNSNGTATYLEQQIRQAGYDLYVIENFPEFSTGSQFGNFQFGDEQYGGITTYRDPRPVPGEIIASSPNGNIGGQFISFGDFQFGDQIQYGTLEPNSSYPVGKGFTIPADTRTWAYVFFISPFPDRLATEIELQALTTAQLQDLKKIIIQLKHVRNWAVVQVTTATIQNKITSDGLYKLTSDGLRKSVSSDI